MGPWTDQFSLCVTLFEALLGRRPFLGETVSELRSSIEHADIAWPAEAEHLPSRLRQALERGLQRDPMQRHASLGRFLAEVRASVPRAAERSVSGPPASPGTASASLHAALPAGLDSHPDLLVPSDPLRIALALCPLRRPEALPIPWLTHRDPYVPVVHARALMAALYDQGFRDDEAWFGFARRVWRSWCASRFTAFRLASPTSPLALADAVAVGREILDPGVRLDIVQPGPPSIVRATAPAGLADRLLRIEVPALLQVILEGASGDALAARARPRDGRSFDVELGGGAS